MKTATADVLVIGGGIVGAACTLALARRGRRVRLLTQDAIGGGATAAGMGHLVVMDDSEAQFALTQFSCRLWDKLVPELPAAAQHSRCGTLWVAADEEEMNAVRSKAEFYSHRGVRAEMLDERQLAEAEPKLRSGLAGALRVPDDAVVYPPVVARFLLDEAQALGAEVHEGVAVAAFDGQSVRRADGAQLAAEAIVLAGGAESVRLLPELPVRPRKGHLVITDRYPGFVRHQLVELGYLKSAHGGGGADSVAFNVQPRPNGQLLLGSSRQYGDESKAIDPAMLERMAHRAFEYMPKLKTLSVIRAWTGFRAATPDKLPLIGPHPTRPGLWLATGHEGLGITTALGTAEILAALMLGEAPPLPAEPYLPNRSFAAEEKHG